MHDFSRFDMGVGPSAEHLSPHIANNKNNSRPRSRTLAAPSHLPTTQPRRPSCPDVLTPFDVRQLMHDQIVKKGSPTTTGESSSSDDEDPLRGLHLLFGGEGPLRNDPSSDAASSASEDSGLGTPARLSLENLDWSQAAQLRTQPTIVVNSPQTPTVDISKLLEKPLVKMPTRFNRKAARVQRNRSQSLYANQQFYDDGEKPSSLFGSSVLNREWELVTVSEMCRRLSLDDLDSLELPTPEGASASQILDELMIRQMMEILPPRAEGYPWVNIYSSEKHGFSLATLYRKMTEFDEDLSPVLLIIRDTKDHVFGAVVSGAIRPSDHYSGTGDSCLLWRFTGVVPHTRDLRHFAWTGDNQFFVNAAKDSLSIGAGGGHYGLWLDADLNHGRSERCDTFNNEPLAGEKEDFIIQFIEAFGFRM